MQHGVIQTKRRTLSSSVIVRRTTPAVAAQLRVVLLKAKLAFFSCCIIDIDRVFFLHCSGCCGALGSLLWLLLALYFSD